MIERSVRMSEEAWEYLGEIAEENDVSVSWVIRMIVKKEMEKEENKPLIELT